MFLFNDIKKMARSKMMKWEKEKDVEINICVYK